jgi:hypothetical protein
MKMERKNSGRKARKSVKQQSHSKKTTKKAGDETVELTFKIPSKAKKMFELIAKHRNMTAEELLRLWIFEHKCTIKYLVCETKEYKGSVKTTAMGVFNTWKEAEEEIRITNDDRYIERMTTISYEIKKILCENFDDPMLERGLKNIDISKLLASDEEIALLEKKPADR